MKTLSWFFTYFVLIFVPQFYICWKVKHKYRRQAVAARIIYLIQQLHKQKKIDL